jgi:hypothetical protein
MEIDISQLASYITTFKNAFTGPQRTEILTQVGRRVGAAAVRIAAEYPEPSRKKLPYFYTRDTVAGKKVKPFKSKFKSDKQAYYVVFVLGKEGKIPYRRTGTLGKSMTSSVTQVTADSVTTEVGTNIPYAQEVIGDNQSHYHKGTWLTLSQRISTNAGKLRDVAGATYVAEIDKRLAR